MTDLAAGLRSQLLPTEVRESVRFEISWRFRATLVL